MPGFPFLALLTFFNPLVPHLPSIFPEAKAKPAAFSCCGGCSRLRYWLCPSLKRPSLGRASKPLHVGLVCRFPTSTNNRRSDLSQGTEALDIVLISWLKH
jgi:hypothetical protein